MPRSFSLQELLSGIRCTRLADLSLQQVSLIHLGSNRVYQTSDFHVHSCLHTLMRDARSANDDNSGDTFSPLLCCFAALDQIGSIYEPEIRPEGLELTNGIKRALCFFANYRPDSAEVKALVAFRNGLIHSGSFTSYDRYKEKHYIFRSRKGSGTLVSLPEETWDGSASGMSEKCTTHIDPKCLYDLTDRIVKDLRLKSLQGVIKISQSVYIDKYTTFEINSEYIINNFLLWAAPQELRNLPVLP